MEGNQIVAVDQLAPSADASLAVAVAHGQALRRAPLLRIGDKPNEINQRSQAAIGAWLTVHADGRGYGALTDLAERLRRKPQTLRSRKHIYMKRQNIEQAQHLPIGKIGPALVRGRSGEWRLVSTLARFIVSPRRLPAVNA